MPDYPMLSSHGSPSSPSKKKRRSIPKKDRERVDILNLPRLDRAAVVMRQIPASLRRGVAFRVREWEGRPWVVAYVTERAEGAHVSAGGWSTTHNFLERILASAELEDGEKLYDNKIIQRCRIPDELLAYLALVT